MTATETEEHDSVGEDLEFATATYLNKSFIYSIFDSLIFSDVLYKGVFLTDFFIREEPFRS